MSPVPMTCWVRFGSSTPLTTAVPSSEMATVSVGLAMDQKPSGTVVSFNVYVPAFSPSNFSRPSSPVVNSVAPDSSLENVQPVPPLTSQPSGPWTLKPAPDRCWVVSPADTLSRPKRNDRSRTVPVEVLVMPSPQSTVRVASDRAASDPVGPDWEIPAL